MDIPFQDRAEGGRQLAELLGAYGQREDVVILALPRGGVPVAFEVAKALEAPLDIFVVRKLGLPGHEELAMGAIATGGGVVLNEDVVSMGNVSRRVIDEVAGRERVELERREREYRGERPAPELAGKVCILIDDGLATGASMRAAAMALREQRPARIVVAVPVAAGDTCDAFRSIVDEVVCAMTPEPFHAVGLWYEDFSQTSDEEVRELLEESQRLHPDGART
jgi:predicted phosphoribosyltransferase